MLNTAVDMVAHFGEKAFVNDSKSFNVKVLSTDDVEMREVPEDTAGLTRFNKTAAILGKGPVGKCTRKPLTYHFFIYVQLSPL